MHRIDAMKALDKQLSGIGEETKDVSGDVVGELRRTAREMELNAICVTAMTQVLESRRSLPQDEWLELVGLVRSRIDALTRISGSAA
jgi:predicted XRE-type DNA-binding protein